MGARGPAIALSNAFGFGGHNVALVLRGLDFMSATLAREPTRRRSPLERLETLCDPGSIQIIRSRVISPRLGARATPGDGVVGGTGTVDGRPIACYAQDGGFLGGSLGERHAATVVRVLETAARADTGDRVRGVGRRADAGGYGGARGLRRDLPETVALSGLVPQIAMVSGRRPGGRVLARAERPDADEQRAAMFLTGPGVVRRDR